VYDGANLLKLFADAQVFVVALVGLVLRISTEILEDEGFYDREFYGNAMLVLLIGTLLPATVTLFYRSPVERVLLSLQEIAKSLPDRAGPTSTIGTPQNVMQRATTSNHSLTQHRLSLAGSDDDVQEARAAAMIDSKEKSDCESKHHDESGQRRPEDHQPRTNSQQDPLTFGSQVQATTGASEKDRRSKTDMLRKRSATPPRQSDKTSMQYASQSHEIVLTGWTASPQRDHRGSLSREPPVLPATRKRSQRSGTPPRANHRKP
jgi:hypothetical protein